MFLELLGGWKWRKMTTLLVPTPKKNDSTQSSGTTPVMTATTLEAKDFSPSPFLDDSDPSSRTNPREYTGSKSSGRARTIPELCDPIEHEVSNPIHLAAGDPLPETTTLGSRLGTASPFFFFILLQK